MLDHVVGAENIMVSKSRHGSCPLGTYNLVEGYRRSGNGQCALGLGGHVCEGVSLGRGPLRVGVHGEIVRARELGRVRAWVCGYGLGIQVWAWDECVARVCCKWGEWCIQGM